MIVIIIDENDDDSGRPLRVKCFPGGIKCVKECSMGD